MGILKEPDDFIRALITSGRLPPRFSMCELGDQYVTHVKNSGRLLAKDHFRALGCGRYVSIDGNGRGDVTADLNRPYHKLPQLTALGEFDLVTDFGTGEHIFDQATVWRTIHSLTRPGGYIAFDRPSQGYKAHCYYLVDMCLFKDVAGVNNYGVVKLERATTSRGELIRGVFRKPDQRLAFVVPQQGRYHKILEIGGFQKKDKAKLAVELVEITPEQIAAQVDLHVREMK